MPSLRLRQNCGRRPTFTLPSKDRPLVLANSLFLDFSATSVSILRTLFNSCHFLHPNPRPSYPPVPHRYSSNRPAKPSSLLHRRRYSQERVLSAKMDGSQAPGNQSMPHQQQHSNLIRTDQVQKLPHLNEQQKVQHTQLVRNLWELLNNRDPQTPDYQNAHMKLTQLSQNLMKGMRAFHQSRQQLQQQQAQAAAPQGQRSQSANPQTFAQLLPQIQTKVNALQFFLPPNINKEQIQTWLSEARLRYGIALQKQEVGRARIAELRQHFGQRQGAGNMGQEEVQEFKTRQLGAEKLYREGTDFLNKFKEQQDNFKQQQINRTGGQNPAAQQPAGPEQRPAPAANENRPSASMQPGQAPTPAPHTISSAVNAARSQPGQSLSPSTSQPGQAAQPQVPPPTSLPQQSPAQQPQQGTPGPQGPFNQPPPSMDGAGAQPVNQQGPPRPLSHQAAIAQAAQNANASAAVNNGSVPPPSAGGTPSAHGHPPGYIPNRGENTSRNINMVIPKSLNVPPPEPVSMAPARPTLSGGPSHGAIGMMGQPAIQKHPGYVLEGEGQRVLSKKMLDGLVRQVTGGGEGEGLTPDAEDVRPNPLGTYFFLELTTSTVRPPNGRRLRRRRHHRRLPPRQTPRLLDPRNPRHPARPRAQLQHAHLRIFLR